MADSNPEDLCQRLPFPIALPASRCRSRQALASPESLFLLLGQALEGLIRYLALLTVSDYLQQGAFAPELNALLLERIGRPLSLGSWLELSREAVRAFLKAGREPRIAGLVSLFSQGGPGTFVPSGFLRGVEDLVTWRNSMVHPKGVPDLAGEVNRRHEAFVGLLGALRFLADYELAVPLRSVKGDPGTVTAKLVCMGHGPFAAVGCRLEVPEPFRGELVLEESPLLVDPSGRRVLMVLYPFFLFDVDPLEELYGYHQSSWRRGMPYRLTYGSCQPKVAPLTIASGESPAHDQVLAAFLRRLQAAAPVGGRPGPTSELESARPARSFDIPSLAIEVEYLLNLFVGRTELAEGLAGWLDRHDRGYVFYEAAAGSGKSAFAASLIDRFGWTGYLARREGRRERPERFLPYVVWTLMERHGLQDYVPEGVPELAESLARVLAQVSQRLEGRDGAREVIIFDGLNELDPGTDLGFFPAVLPPRVFVVVLSQPCRQLEALRARVAVYRAEFDLPGLADVEVHRMLDLAGLELSEADRTRIIGRAKGWPLYLRLVIDAHHAREPWSAIPASLEGLYDQVVDRAGTGSDALRVLGALWVARESLGLPGLAEITGLLRHEVRDVLEPWRPYLLSAARRVSIFHETFREYLGRAVFGPVEAAGHRVAIVDWCRLALLSNPYALRHLADHLCELGRYEEASDLLARDDLLAAMMQLPGDPHEVVEVYDRVRNACQHAGRHDLAERVDCQVLALRPGGDRETADPAENAVRVAGELARLADGGVETLSLDRLDDVSRRLKQTVYEAASDDDREQALALLRRVTREGVVARLDALDPRREPDRSVAVLEEALSILPDEYLLYHRLAAVLSELGEWPRLYALMDRARLAPLTPKQHRDVARFETQELIIFWRQLPTPIPPEAFSEIRARLNVFERRFRDTPEFLAVSGLYLYAVIGQMLLGPFSWRLDGPEAGHLGRTIDEYEGLSRRYQTLPDEARTELTERVMRTADDQILRVARAKLAELRRRSHPPARAASFTVAAFVWMTLSQGMLSVSARTPLATVQTPGALAVWLGLPVVTAVALAAARVWAPGLRWSRLALAALLLAALAGLAPWLDPATAWRGSAVRFAAATAALAVSVGVEKARRERVRPRLQPLISEPKSEVEPGPYVRPPPLADRSIAVFGAPHSGRSFYVVALANTLRRASLPRINVRLDPETAREFNETVEHFLRRIPMKTPHRLTTEVTLMLDVTRSGWRRLVQKPMATYRLVNVEPAGEHLHSMLSDDYDYLKDLYEASALICTICWPASPQVRFDYYSFSLLELVRRLRYKRALLQPRLIDMPLAVVVTKCDLPDSIVPFAELEQFPRQGQEYDSKLAERMSKLVRHELLSRCPNLVMDFESSFSRVAYFAVSAVSPALGINPNLDPDRKADTLNWAPYRVEEPLLWVLHQWGDV